MWDAKPWARSETDLTAQVAERSPGEDLWHARLSSLPTAAAMKRRCERAEDIESDL
jgi:hypothetical protein